MKFGHYVPSQNVYEVKYSRHTELLQGQQHLSNELSLTSCLANLTTKSFTNIFLPDIISKISIFTGDGSSRFSTGLTESYVPWHKLPNDADWNIVSHSKILKRMR